MPDTPGAPGIAAAMAGIDQHDRPAGQPRLANPDVGDRFGQHQGESAGPRLADQRDRIADDAGPARASGQRQQRDGSEHRRADRQPDFPPPVHWREVTVRDGRAPRAALGDYFDGATVAAPAGRMLTGIVLPTFGRASAASAQDRGIQG